MLYGMDIKQAATSLIKQGTKGGETNFDQLSGLVNRERGAIRLTQLKIASGALAAEGNVTISPPKNFPDASAPRSRHSAPARVCH